jgi:hypothetical protein
VADVEVRKGQGKEGRQSGEYRGRKGRTIAGRKEKKMPGVVD